MAYREAALETKASPDRVWRVWSDVNHWHEWNPDMKESRINGPLKLGATGMIDTRSGGKHDVVVQLTRKLTPDSVGLEQRVIVGARKRDDRCDLIGPWIRD